VKPEKHWIKTFQETLDLRDCMFTVKEHIRLEGGMFRPQMPLLTYPGQASCELMDTKQEVTNIK
jgi:hypothetical protein